MKKIKLFSLLFVGLLLFSCSDDDSVNDMDGNGETISNAFKVNDDTYSTPIAIHSIYENHIQITLINENFLSDGYEGALNFVGFLISSEDGEIVPGTYTFLNESDPNYDPSVNFFDSEAGIAVQYANNEADLSSGYFETEESGSITIQKEGDIYEFEYELNFGTTVFKGNFKGEVLLNDTTKIETADLLGKWELIDLYENGVREDVECMNNDTLEFFANNEATFTVYREGRLDAAGEVFRVCVDTPQPDNVTWSLAEKTVTFDFGGGDLEEGQITEISAERLVLEYYYEEDGATLVDQEIYQKAGSN